MKSTDRDDICVYSLLVFLTSFLVQKTVALGRQSHNLHLTEEKKYIYIGALISDENALIAIKEAFKDINEDPHVLPHYLLRLSFQNMNECDASEAYRRYSDIVEILPRKLAFLSGLCSGAEEEISKSSVNTILKLSFTNWHKSSSFFSLVPSHEFYNEALKTLITNFSWKDKKVGTIYESSRADLSLAHDALVKTLVQNGVSVLKSSGVEGSGNNVHLALRQLKGKDVNLVIGQFGENTARRIFCAIYKEKMYGEKYRWILIGKFKDLWWKVDDTDCFPHELERALDGMIRIDLLPYQFQKRTSAFYKKDENMKSKSSGYAYDATWALALALHNLTYFYPQNQHNSDEPLDKFQDLLTNSSISFQNPIWDEALKNSLMSLSFPGVTGRVSFNKKHRIGYSAQIKQFQDRDEVNIGEFESSTKELDLNKYPHRVIAINRRNDLVPSSPAEPHRHEDKVDSHQVMNDNNEPKPTRSAAISVKSTFKVFDSKLIIIFLFSNLVTNLCKIFLI